MIKNRSLSLGFILCALLFSSCALLPEEEILPPPIIPRVEIALVTETVGRGDIVDYVRVTGRAASVNQYNINLNFDIPSAVLIEHNINPDNRRVEAGDVLAVFAADDLEGQIAPLKRALELVQINYSAALHTLAASQAYYANLQRRTELRRAEILNDALTDSLQRERDINRLRTRINDAVRRYESDRVLFELGVVSQDEISALERAVQDLENELAFLESIPDTGALTTDIQLNQLEQNLRAARAAANNNAAALREALNLRTAEENLKNLEERIESFILRAPTGGIITYFAELFVGDTYRDGERLFTIADDTTLSVTIAFAERRHLFTPGSRVELSATVLVDDERRGIEFDGTVISLSTDQRRDALLDDDTIVIDVPDWPEQIELGDLVWVYLIRAQVYDVVTIPLNALNTTGDFHFVRVAENGVSRERQVEVGIRSSTMVEITHGLSPGEEIVSR